MQSLEQIEHQLDSLGIHGVSLRAQSVTPGDLFAALPGARAHGAQFIDQARAAGAAAVLTDQLGADVIGPTDIPVLTAADPRAVLGEISAHVYGYPSRALTLVGITGTSGKTTTSYFAEAALATRGGTGLIGTVETRINGVVQPSALTTPEAPDLQHLLADMRAAHARSVVMEVSSHALELGRVAGSDFALGAFTNLSRDHLDFHPTMSAYFAAKARLFDPASPVAARRAVICVDDEWGRRMARIAPHPITVATTESESPLTPDWTASASRLRGNGAQVVTAHGPEGPLEVEVPLPGRYNVANALTALALAVAAGVPGTVAAEAISRVTVPGRLQRVGEQDFLAIVDYAHKPGAVAAVLATLREQLERQQHPGRIAIVVGAGGDRDTEKRPLMGAAAAEGAELVIVTDDNPRTEEPAAIRRQLLAGARAASRPAGAEPIREIGSRGEAIAAAIDWARPGDIVLIAGKGHEPGQEIAGVKHPFDDREQVRAALARKASGGKDGQ